MVITINLTPTEMYPVRRVTLIRVDRGNGPLEAALEVQQQHKAPNGKLVTRFTVHETGKGTNPGDRLFELTRPGFVDSEWVCVARDSREFPTCTCRKWIENAWCLHVEVLYTLQNEKALEPLPL